MSRVAPVPAVEVQRALTRAQAGDAAAFETLVREHQSLVFSLAYHFTGNRATAEDLAQDVFLELFRALRRIDSPAHLTFWLRRVTTNRCIDRSRRGARSEVTVDLLPERAAPEQIGDVLLDARIRDAIAALPADPRAVMILRYQEDLDVPEIGRMLDMPVNTVKSHLRRSVERLREELAVKERV
jgi:RNA polymerase sigma-70 factor (ECF subfamily)